MKKTLSIIALGALGWLGTAPAASAQDQGDERAATSAAPYLLVPTSARTASLGNSLTGGLNGLSGIEAAASNPSALASTPGTTALFSRTEYVADIGVNHFGVGQPVGNGAIALTVTSWDYGDIPATTESQSDPGVNTFDAGATIVGGTYARAFTDRISAGLTAKFINERIDDISASSVAFDAGIGYEVGESGLQFGVSLRNFGGKMEFGGNGLRTATSGNGTPVSVDTEPAELPSLLNFGASYTRQFAGDLSASAIGNFRANSYDQQQFAGGLELGYGNLVFVRGGVDIVPDQDQTFYQGWSAGAGVNLDLGASAIKVDYAYRGTDFFDGVNMFTAAVSL